MKKNSIFIIIFLVGSLYPLAFADAPSLPPEEHKPFLWGDVKTEEGVKFTIRDVRIDEWINAPNLAQKQEDGLTTELMNMIALTYGLTNETENRKIDLTEDFVFKLTDEFGNQYQELEKPLNYPAPVTVHNKHFPSLYPGDDFTASIFFEAPVKTSQVLNFVIDAQNIGVDRLVSFHLPVVRALPVPAEQRLVLGDDDMQITVPENVHPVKPGDKIPIKVKLSEKILPPDSIYVIAPFYLYEDKNSAGQYELLIPQHQPEGPLTVIILASWRNDGQEETLSKSFTVMVENPQPCSQDCLTSNN